MGLTPYALVAAPLRRRAGTRGRRTMRGGVSDGWSGGHVGSTCPTEWRMRSARAIDPLWRAPSASPRPYCGQLGGTAAVSPPVTLAPSLFRSYLIAPSVSFAAHGTQQAVLYCVIAHFGPATVLALAQLEPKLCLGGGG